MKGISILPKLCLISCIPLMAVQNPYFKHWHGQGKRKIYETYSPSTFLVLHNGWQVQTKASVNLGMRTNNGLRGRQIKEKRKVERETDGRSAPDRITSVCSSMHGRSIDDHHGWLY